jgi:hypothetical protein
MVYVRVDITKVAYSIVPGSLDVNNNSLAIHVSGVVRGLASMQACQERGRRGRGGGME